MILVLLLAVSCYSTTGSVIPPPVLEEGGEDQASYYLVPLTMLGEGDITQQFQSSQPDTEQVLEALLSQMDEPEESEAIYNSLINSMLQKKDAESLQHQLNVLKPESFHSPHIHQDIDDRKHFNQDQQINLRRKKRSLPPYVESSPSLNRRMH